MLVFYGERRRGMKGIDSILCTRVFLQNFRGIFVNKHEDDSTMSHSMSIAFDVVPFDFSSTYSLMAITCAFALFLRKGIRWRRGLLGWSGRTRERDGQREKEGDRERTRAHRRDIVS